MEYQNLIYEVKNNVAYVKFNRPEAFNALSAPMSIGLRHLFDEINNDKEVHCAVLTGVGKAFCSGGDVGTESEANVIYAYKMTRAAAQNTNKMESLRVPIIAAINGYCLGGGLEYALGCDFRIAADNAKFGLPEVNLGVFPGGGGTQRLPRLIGKSQALKMMYTGDRYTAQQALELGFVDEVVPADQLMNYVTAVAEKIAAKPPLAVEYIKIATTDGLETDLQRGLQIESALFAQLYCTEDMKEGMRAFLEKRPPKKFVGR